eukprot:CAMPEP_0115172516 /NCGR_PEP_ID=MMETSP0270-20121206/2854_1 /TAXON_ID=71861 /ORGANISM="Scrippsiella trochoidea, Strain CCMP3099" /LENGTH=605 /DNA_ID=CAMNT_0002585307 /DNA_START=104 /DNA_END=1917 /DNA_ORIENTATION=-
MRAWSSFALCEHCAYQSALLHLPCSSTLANGVALLAPAALLSRRPSPRQPQAGIGRLGLAPVALALLWLSGAEVGVEAARPYQFGRSAVDRGHRAHNRAGAARQRSQRAAVHVPMHQEAPSVKKQDPDSGRQVLLTSTRAPSTTPALAAATEAPNSSQVVSPNSTEAPNGSQLPNGTGMPNATENESKAECEKDTDCPFDAIEFVLPFTKSVVHNCSMQVKKVHHSCSNEKKCVARNQDACFDGPDQSSSVVCQGDSTCQPRVLARPSEVRVKFGCDSSQARLGQRCGPAQNPCMFAYAFYRDSAPPLALDDAAMLSFATECPGITRHTFIPSECVASQMNETDSQGLVAQVCGFLEDAQCAIRDAVGNASALDHCARGTACALNPFDGVYRCRPRCTKRLDCSLGDMQVMKFEAGQCKLMSETFFSECDAQNQVCTMVVAEGEACNPYMMETHCDEGTACLQQATFDKFNNLSEVRSLCLAPRDFDTLPVGPDGACQPVFYRLNETNKSAVPTLHLQPPLEMASSEVCRPGALTKDNFKVLWPTKRGLFCFLKEGQACGFAVGTENHFCDQGLRCLPDGEGSEHRCLDGSTPRSLVVRTTAPAT